MNTQILKRADALIESQFTDSGIAGASLLVMQGGDTAYRKCYGKLSLETGEAMREDAIFRCYSMTKPVTAAAVLLLIEQGKLHLADEVCWYIPSFANQNVLLEDGSLVPAKRNITILDLLTMTAGLVYPDASFPAGKIMDEAYAQIADKLAKGTPTTTLEYCNMIGSKPLAFQPGEKWLYSTCADVLGGIVEIISGKSFRNFLKDEIFTPLDMPDTDFYVPEDKLSRLMGYYQYDDASGKLQPVQWQHLGLSYMWKQPPAFESGGAGLVSTVEDYSHFASMLLKGGTYKGTRILGRKSIEFMSASHLTEQQMKSYDWTALKGYGYGCLVRTMLSPTTAGMYGSVGEFGWDGWAGCYMMVDPAEDLLMIYVIQKAGGNGERAIHMLRDIVYSALD